MSKPKIAGTEAITVNLEEGKEYAWCACGESSSQPFCDGSHSGTGYSPLMFTATESGPQYLCACKYTKAPPYCDDAHKCLPKEG